MYAIVRTGGKQYRLQPGDVVRVEKLEQPLGTEFDLPEVLFVGGEKVFVGKPTLAQAKVTVVVTQQSRDAKVLVFKKRRRQGYRRTQGHRQAFTELFVKSITTPEGKTAGADSKAVVVDPKKKEERLARLAAASEGKKANAPAKKAKKAPAVKAKAAAPKKKAAKKAAPKKKAVKKATKKVSKK